VKVICFQFFFRELFAFLINYDVYVLPAIHYSARMMPFENKIQEGSIKWAVTAVYRNDCGVTNPFEHPASGRGIEPVACRKPEACLVFIRRLLAHTSSYPALCQLILGRQLPTAIWSRGECTSPFSQLLIMWCLLKEKGRQDELCHVGLGMLCDAMSTVRSSRLRNSFPMFIVTSGEPCVFGAT